MGARLIDLVDGVDRVDFVDRADFVDWVDVETQCLASLLFKTGGGEMALPIRYVKYCEQAVKVYEVEGKHYMTGEDLGKCLGYVNPGTAVRKIFNRNKDELEQHTLFRNLRNTYKDQTSQIGTPGTGEDQACQFEAHDNENKMNGQDYNTRLYSEVGCYLVTMFARTPKAKEVRLWLAELPEKLRTIRRRYKHLREESDLVALAKAEGLVECDPKQLGDPAHLEQLIDAKVEGNLTHARQVRYYYRKEFKQTGKISYGLYFREGRKAAGRRPVIN